MGLGFTAVNKVIPGLIHMENTYSECELRLIKQKNTSSISLVNR